MVIRIWLVSAAIAVALALPGVANATVENLTISGSLDEGKNSCLCGNAVSRRYRRAGYRWNRNPQHPRTNAPLVLITKSSPGNEGSRDSMTHSPERRTSRVHSEGRLRAAFPFTKHAVPNELASSKSPSGLRERGGDCCSSGRGQVR